MDAPDARMGGVFVGWDVAHGLSRAVIAHMGIAASCIPIDHKRRPAMVVHGNVLAGRRHIDFEDADQLIFENQLVTFGSGLQSVEAIGKIGFVLPVEIEIAGSEDKKKNRERCEGFANRSGEERSLHVAQYSAGGKEATQAVGARIDSRAAVRSVERDC